LEPIDQEAAMVLPAQKFEMAAPVRTNAPIAGKLRQAADILTA